MDEKNQKKYIAYLKLTIDTLTQHLKVAKRKNKELERQITYYKSKIK